jgi:N-methylhydantoinase A/oxoprolinase/acetone carboxylase beta subunit
MKRCRLGADVGGIFTDPVMVDSEGRISYTKVPSTPRYQDVPFIFCSLHYWERV